jgi:hypothetical protein
MRLLSRRIGGSRVFSPASPAASSGSHPDPPSRPPACSSFSARSPRPSPRACRPRREINSKDVMVSYGYCQIKVVRLKIDVSGAVGRDNPCLALVLQMVQVCGDVEDIGPMSRKQDRCKINDFHICSWHGSRRLGKKVQEVSHPRAAKTVLCYVCGGTCGETRNGGS